MRVTHTRKRTLESEWQSVVNLCHQAAWWLLAGSLEVIERMVPAAWLSVEDRGRRRRPSSTQGGACVCSRDVGFLSADSSRGLIWQKLSATTARRRSQWRFCGHRMSGSQCVLVDAGRRCNLQSLASSGVPRERCASASLCGVASPQRVPCANQQRWLVVHFSRVCGAFVVPALAVSVEYVVAPAWTQYLRQWWRILHHRRRRQRISWCT